MHLRGTRWLLFVASVVLVAVTTYAQDKPLQYLRVGSPNDVTTSTRAGFMLIGGGKDIDVAFQWMCERSGGGDFLVLRASGTDAYNPYIRDLCKLNSVATLILPSRAAANDPNAADQIRHAEAVFISGGDQANYVNFWKGTPVQTAINDAIKRGVPIGGTSAGLAVLGEFAFAALNDTAYSKVVLKDPFDKTVTLERGFLTIDQLKGIVTDTHFAARDRLGRLLTFMARLLQDGWTRDAKAIAVDQEAAFALDPSGKGSVMGKGAVYFLRASDPPATCRAGAPLTFSKIAVYKEAAGESFDLTVWKGDGGTAYELSVKDGVIASTQPGGSPY